MSSSGDNPPAPAQSEDKDKKKDGPETVEKGQPRDVNPLAPPINNRPGS